MVNDSIKITGDVKIDIIGADGSIKDSREIKNLVVTTGKTFIASRMVGVASTVMGWMELGTGTTAAAVGDTALQTAIAGSRVALTSGTSATNVVTYVASSQPVQELALLLKQVCLTHLAQARCSAVQFSRLLTKVQLML